MPARTEKTLEDLFHDTLKDIYYAKREIAKALPKMAEGAESLYLDAAFQKHLEETEGHVERLQQVFDLMGKRAQGKTCPAIEGILQEGEEVLDEFKDSPALDAGLISAAQALEHYEITRYGTLKRWAEELGMTDAAPLFDQTLAEESMTDEAYRTRRGGLEPKGCLTHSPLTAIGDCRVYVSAGSTPPVPLRSPPCLRPGSLPGRFLLGKSGG